MIDDQKCHLLGGVFSSFIQACLATLCITTLIIKRQNEVPKREWFVWFLDVMKQGVGSSFGHFSNIFLSVVIAQSLSGGDECQWYCLTYVIDSTFGTFFNLLFLSCFEKVVQHYQYAPEYLNFGEYGDPPNMHVFSLQLAIWLTIVILGKAIILFCLLQLIVPIDNSMSVAFRVFHNHPDIELVMVMIVIPGVLNTLQFWVTDTFLKKQHNTGSSLSSGVINGTGLSRTSQYRMSGGGSSAKFDHVPLSNGSGDDLDEELIDGNDDDDEDQADATRMHSTFLGAFSPGTQRHKKKKLPSSSANSKDSSSGSGGSSAPQSSGTGGARGLLGGYLTTADISPGTKLYVVPPTSAITRLYKQTGIPYVWTKVFGSPTTRGKGGGGGVNRGSSSNSNFGSDDDKQSPLSDYAGGSTHSGDEGGDEEECSGSGTKKGGLGYARGRSGVATSNASTRSKGSLTHSKSTAPPSPGAFTTSVVDRDIAGGSGVNSKTNRDNKKFDAAEDAYL